MANQVKPWEKLKRTIKSERFRRIRKIVVLVVGSVVVAVGVVLIFIPGPAILVIPAGFGILATEFRWADRWVQKTRAWLKNPRQMFRKLQSKK